MSRGLLVLYIPLILISGVGITFSGSKYLRIQKLEQESEVLEGKLVELGVPREAHELDKIYFVPNDQNGVLEFGDYDSFLNNSEIKSINDNLREFGYSREYDTILDKFCESTEKKAYFIPCSEYGIRSSHLYLRYVYEMLLRRAKYFAKTGNNEKAIDDLIAARRFVYLCSQSMNTGTVDVISNAYSNYQRACKRISNEVKDKVAYFELLEQLEYEYPIIIDYSRLTKLNAYMSLFSVEYSQIDDKVYFPTKLSRLENEYKVKRIFAQALEDLAQDEFSVQNAIISFLNEEKLFTELVGEDGILIMYWGYNDKQVQKLVHFQNLQMLWIELWRYYHKYNKNPSSLHQLDSDYLKYFTVDDYEYQYRKLDGMANIRIPKDDYDDLGLMQFDYCEIWQARGLAAYKKPHSREIVIYGQERETED